MAFFSGPVKWMSLMDDSLDLMVFGNFDVVRQNATISFPAAGKWYSYLTDSTAMLQSVSQTVFLDPGEYFVFCNRYMALQRDTSTPPPVQVSGLHIRVLPKPAGSSASIKYDLS